MSDYELYWWLTWRQFLVWWVRGRLLFISTTICQSFAAIFLRPHQRAGWQHSVQLPRSSKRRVGLHLALSGARGTSGSGAATRASFTSVKKTRQAQVWGWFNKTTLDAPKNNTQLKQFGSKSIFLVDTNDEDGLSSTWVEFSAIIVQTEQRFNEFEQNGSQRLIKRSVGDRTIGKTLPTKIITSNEAATVTDRWQQQHQSQQQQ